MSKNFIDLSQLNILLSEVGDIKNCIERDMDFSNDALSEIGCVLGCSTKVSKSIERFQNATLEEKRRVSSQLTVLEEFLKSKIRAYTELNDDSISSKANKVI